MFVTDGQFWCPIAACARIVIYTNETFDSNMVTHHAHWQQQYLTSEIFFLSYCHRSRCVCVCRFACKSAVRCSIIQPNYVAFERASTNITECWKIDWTQCGARTYAVACLAPVSIEYSKRNAHYNNGL